MYLVCTMYIYTILRLIDWEKISHWRGQTWWSDPLGIIYVCGLASWQKIKLTINVHEPSSRPFRAVGRLFANAYWRRHSDERNNSTARRAKRVSWCISDRRNPLVVEPVPRCRSPWTQRFAYKTGATFRPCFPLSNHCFVKCSRWCNMHCIMVRVNY